MNVFLIAAITIDGFIGRDANHAATWTSTADKQLFVELTKRAGVMVMGRKTYDTIGRALPERHTIVYSRQKLDLTERVTQTDVAPDALVEQLEKQGYSEVAICGGQAIYSLFLAAGLIDELYLTIEPQLFGQGISLFDKSMDVTLELLDSRELAPSVMLCHYKVIRKI
jgi:dihydrofolate reductase